MNDDELSDRLRHLVDRAQPVDLDEVTHRRRARGHRPLVVALTGAAVLALVVGAVALLRIDRDDAAPVTTEPAPTSMVPATTSTTTPSVGLVPQFVGITTDGRLVVVDARTGEEVLELDRMGDPTAPRDPADGPGPNVIQSVDRMATGQVLYGDCCEPAAGTIFAIGLDGSPTTLPVIDEQGERDVVARGWDPAVTANGELAVASGGAGAIETSSFPGDVPPRTIDPEHVGSAAAPAWLDQGDSRSAPWLAYEVAADGRRIVRLVAVAEEGGAVVTTVEPPSGTSYTDPLGVPVVGRSTGGVLVVEQAGGDPNVVDSYDSSTARVLDTSTHEVLRSFPFDGIVVDLDTSVTGAMLATFADGRVARIDSMTGESQVIATGFTAASW